MPIYEYQCNKCGELFEVFQKFSDKPQTKCQHCSGKLSKLISQSAFHLKGSGWYVTDYASKAPKKKSDTKKQNADNNSQKSSDSGSSSKTEAKSEK